MENVIVPRLPVAGSTILICPRAVRYRPVPPVIAPILTDGGLLRNCTEICPAASTKVPWQAASGWEGSVTVHARPLCPTSLPLPFNRRSFSMIWSPLLMPCSPRSTRKKSLNSIVNWSVCPSRLAERAAASAAVAAPAATRSATTTTVTTLRGMRLSLLSSIFLQTVCLNSRGNQTEPAPISHRKAGGRRGRDALARRRRRARGVRRGRLPSRGDGGGRPARRRHARHGLLPVRVQAGTRRGGARRHRATRRAGPGHRRARAAGRRRGHPARVRARNPLLGRRARPRAQAERRRRGRSRDAPARPGTRPPSPLARDAARTTARRSR